MFARTFGRGLLLAAATGLLAAPAAAGQAGIVGFSPSVHSAASHFVFDGRGQSAGWLPNMLPSTIGLRFPAGLKWDTKAAADTCKPDEARADNCPERSKIGTGGVDVTFAGAAYHAALAFYLAPPPSTGDIAGIVLHFREASSGFHDAGTGRLVRVTDDPAYGTELRFDRLPIPQVPGLVVTINRWTTDLGADRDVVVIRRKRVRRKGRRRVIRIRRVVHHSLITNPPTCSGPWPVRIQIGYGSRQEVRQAQAPCL
jgi:hypothetical protein